MIDGPTKREIDKVVTKTLSEAGMNEPPFLHQGFGQVCVPTGSGSRARGI